MATSRGPKRPLLHRTPMWGAPAVPCQGLVGRSQELPHLIRRRVACSRYLLQLLEWRRPCFLVLIQVFLPLVLLEPLVRFRIREVITNAISGNLGKSSLGGYPKDRVP